VDEKGQDIIPDVNYSSGSIRQVLRYSNIFWQWALLTWLPVFLLGSTAILNLARIKCMNCYHILLSKFQTVPSFIERNPMDTEIQHSHVYIYCGWE
jgi:hypothetical protein